MQLEREARSDRIVKVTLYALYCSTFSPHIQPITSILLFAELPGCVTISVFVRVNFDCIHNDEVYTLV